MNTTWREAAGGRYWRHVESPARTARVLEASDRAARTRRCDGAGVQWRGSPSDFGEVCAGRDESRRAAAAGVEVILTTGDRLRMALGADAATVARFRRNSAGLYVLAVANGQTWLVCRAGIRLHVWAQPRSGHRSEYRPVDIGALTSVWRQPSDDDNVVVPQHTSAGCATDIMAPDRDC